MKKDRFNELVGIFKRMTVENQLRLIEFMATDISLYDVEPECKNQLKAAYRLLDCIEQKLHIQKKNAEFAEMMNMVGTLSINQLMELLNEVSKLVHEFDADNKQKAAECMCETEGHVFSEWTKREYNKYISPVEAYGIDGLWGSNNPHARTIPVPITDWIRTCDRCGYEEVVKEEPAEVREVRLTKEKKARIRELKKELQELEGSDQ